MPPKKRKGGQRPGAGRPSTKGVGNEGHELDYEEKAEYDRQRKAKSRGQDTPARGRSQKR